MAEETITQDQNLDHESARALFERFYDLLNEHDLGRIPEIFTEDILFEDDAAPETVRGHDEMRKFLEMIWTAFPDFRFELLNGPYLDEGGRVALHVGVTGTMRGRLDPPGFAPSNARFSVEYGGFYELEDDRIRHARIVVNMNDAATQLGIMPPPGSAGEKTLVALQRVQAAVQRRRAG